MSSSCASSSPRTSSVTRSSLPLSTRPTRTMRSCCTCLVSPAPQLSPRMSHPRTSLPSAYPAVSPSSLLRRIRIPEPNSARPSADYDYDYSLKVIERRISTSSLPRAHRARRMASPNASSHRCLHSNYTSPNSPSHRLRLPRPLTRRTRPSSLLRGSLGVYSLLSTTIRRNLPTQRLLPGVWRVTTGVMLGPLQIPRSRC
jgi:hypothetical protein